MSDTTEWWVLPEGVPWQVALNGKNKSRCLNVITGQQCTFVELVQKTHKMDEAAVVNLIANFAVTIDSPGPPPSP